MMYSLIINNMAIPDSFSWCKAKLLKTHAVQIPVHTYAPHLGAHFFESLLLELHTMNEIQSQHGKK